MVLVNLGEQFTDLHLYIEFSLRVQILNCDLDIDFRRLKVHAKFVDADALVFVEIHDIVYCAKVRSLQSFNMNLFVAAS